MTEDLTHADLPKIDVEHTVTVPDEIEDLARNRFRTAKARGEVPDGITLEDYLMDHVHLSVVLEFSNETPN